jgi:hypothetical protein
VNPYHPTGFDGGKSIIPLRYDIHAAACAGAKTGLPHQQPQNNIETWLAGITRAK